MRKIKIYFKDAATSTEITMISMFAEGPLLRIVHSENLSVWYPVDSIFKIEEQSDS